MAVGRVLMVSGTLGMWFMKVEGRELEGEAED